MCGIAGYIGRQAIPDARIDAALARMWRRGPDHRAYRHFVTGTQRHVYLLHSRLSILDLDPRSNQPFGRDGRWLAFNGEIYNYVELKRELRDAGHEFETTSDTEVLLAALQRWGTDTLNRAEGMWGFAYYNERDGSLLLARDPFGEKPLYLFRDDSGLYFASEVKFLSALAGRTFTPNRSQLVRFLVNGHKSLYKSGQTFFNEVRELPWASAIEVSPSGEERAFRYWRPAFRPDEAMSYDQAVAGTRERVLRAVETRLRADVPLAFCMSGGVDSATIISTAKKIFDYDVHAFTITIRDPRYNEEDVIEQTVRELDLRHTTIPSSSGTLDDLRTLIRYHDAPVHTISYFMHWLLMRSVHEHGYRISVMGTGADEFFTGYYDHHLEYLYDMRHDRGAHDSYLRGWLEHVKSEVRNPYLQTPDLYAVRGEDFRDYIYLGADGFAKTLHTPFHEPFREEVFTNASLLRNRTLNELFAEVVSVILHDDDLNAMYYSIENRSPFLDRPLLDWALRIPVKYLMRDGMQKVVLRDAMRGIVPDAVLDSRRKVGFNAPFHDIVKTSEEAARQMLLDESPIFELVDRGRIEKFLEKEFLPNSESKFLFFFVGVKMFLEEFGACA